MESIASTIANYACSKANLTQGHQTKQTNSPSRSSPEAPQIDKIVIIGDT